MQLLKTISPEVVHELSEMGFSYTIEQINRKNYYCFFVSEDMVSKFAAQHYDCGAFFVDQTLSF